MSNVQMTVSYAVVSTCLLLLVVACGSSGQTPASPSTTPTTGTTANGCTARPSGQSGPVTDPNGPFFHQMAVATTDEGTAIRDAQIVLDHASVPDGTRMPDGGVGVYYVNGADGSVWLARLFGGSASPVGAISLDGVARPQGVVDPDAIRLPSRRIRLFYLSGFGPPTGGQTHLHRRIE